MAKIRTFPGVIKKLVVEIGSLCKETKDRICVISHTCNEKFAKVLKELISKAYHFKEVIIAVRPSIEGETTSLYIKRILDGMNIKVTRIASGIPIGADMDYVDPLTLERAMVDRKELE